jgi:hypothetical protein
MNTDVGITPVQMNLWREISKAGAGEQPGWKGIIMVSPSDVIPSHWTTSPTTSNSDSYPCHLIHGPEKGAEAWISATFDGMDTNLIRIVIR